MNSLRVGSFDGQMVVGGDPEKPHLIDWSLLYSVDMQIYKEDRGRYSKLPLQNA